MVPVDVEGVVSASDETEVELASDVRGAEVTAVVGTVVSVELSICLNFIALADDKFEIMPTTANVRIISTITDSGNFTSPLSPDLASPFPCLIAVTTKCS